MDSSREAWRIYSDKAAAFGDYLIDKGCVEAQDIDRAYAYLQSINPRLGDLAVEKDLLSPSNVDTVLDHQASSGTLFGEAAVQAGLLDSNQIDDLVNEQNHLVLHLGHALFATGSLSAEQMINELVKFELHHQGGGGSETFGEKPDQSKDDEQRAA